MTKAEAPNEGPILVTLFFGLAILRHRPWPAGLVDRYVGESPLRHFLGLAGVAALDPAFYIDRQRRPADLHDRGIAAQQIADHDRTVKLHGVHRDGRHA